MHISSVTRVFKSSTRGTFIGATFLSSFFFSVLYIYKIQDVYDLGFKTTFKGLYLSSSGLTISLYIPLFVGSSTAFLVMVLRKIRHKYQGKNGLKFFIELPIIFLYLIGTFIGSLLVIYLAS